MKVKYLVITKIDEDTTYTPFAYKKDDMIIVDDSYDFDCDSIPKEDWLMTKVKKNVFQIGELLIVNEYGREGEFGRKPDKWFVEYREFDDPIKAMRFSNKIQSKIIYGKLDA